jgi:hypothetical protein
MQSALRKEIAMNEVGSVDQILKRFRPYVGLNEGANETVSKTVKSVTQVPVHGETDDIQIDLTDSKNIHVCEFNRSYFTLHFEIDIDVVQGRFPFLPTDGIPDWLPTPANDTWENWTEVPALQDLAKITYFFIGFKNATDCIKFYRIVHNGRDVGPTIKDKVQLESYLYNVMKPAATKKNKANTHSLWEDVHKHNNSVCGKYLSMWELYQQSTNPNNTITIDFPVIIGFDDLLPFQNFGDFPSCVLGDFRLIIRVSPDALVWCSVSPVESIRQMSEIFNFNENGQHKIYNYKHVANLIGSTNQQASYDHRFTQVNTAGRAASNVVADNPLPGETPTAAGYEGVDILLKPRSITTYTAESIISGYKLNPTYITYIRDFYQNEPFVVPAELVYTDNMGGTGPDSTGINVTKQFKFTHVKEVCVLFPRYPSDLTVHFNPCLDKLSLTMFNHDYPDKETNTTSARFLRSQLEAMVLDSLLTCTESLEQSYTSPPSYTPRTRDRSFSDNSDFVFVIPVERESANAFFFDGLDSGANTENITLAGRIIRDNKSGLDMDTYYNLARNDNTDVVPNRTPPIICLVSDSFWLFTSHNGGTVEYNTKDTWNELFLRRFPDLYNSLMRAYLQKYNVNL